MKKICYGLLLACSIMFGLSLNDYSDVSALKYSYELYPVIPKLLFVGDQEISQPSQTLSFTFSNDTQGLSAPAGTFNNNSGQPCQSQGTSSIFYLESSSSFKSIYSAGRFLNPFALPTSLSAPYVSDSNSFDVPCKYLASYDYSSFVGGQVNLVSGDFDKFISIGEFYSDSFASNSGDLYDASIPLDISMNSVGLLPANEPISIDFQLFTYLPFTNVDSSPTARLLISYFPFDVNTYQGTVSSLYQSRFNNYSVDNDTSYNLCSIDPTYEGLKVNDDLTFLHYYSYRVTCSYTPSTPMSHVFMTLQLSSSSNSQPLFHWSDGLFFGSSYLITNGDDTWSGQSANEPLTGEHISYAPGYSDIYCDNGVSGCDGDCLDGDYLCNLSKLFDFNSFNPFAPMFNLFTDNSSCASIPIIAGMLNSEETIYCPWFSSDTRNILTPVLGLVGAMLVFGFFVRWLGSSSGNMFEDQTSHKWSNTQIGKKGAK